MVEQIRAALQAPISIQEAIAGAQAGNPDLHAIFANAGRVLGMAAANAVNLLNPSLIILGGEGTRAGSLLMEPFIRSLRAHCFDGLFEDLEVVTEPWGDEAWARGAASLLLGELFEPALHSGQTERPSLTTRHAP
jgi:predicted NBD/HSP70 family sugar kinase